jgi:hypothetical protein
MAFAQYGNVNIRSVVEGGVRFKLRQVGGAGGPLHPSASPNFIPTSINTL